MEEEVLTEDEKNNIEVIQSLDSPEKIQAMEEIFNEEAPETPDKTEVKPEVEDKAEDKAKEVEEGVEDKKSETEETPEAPKTPEVEDKAEDKVNSFEVTDEYIEKAPEKDRAILSTIKGEILSPKALKNYLNAQRLLGKRTQDLLKHEDKPIQQINQPQLAEEGEKPEEVKEKLVLQQLKGIYPDLPVDKTEQEEYLRELNYDHPLEFQKFVRSREKIYEQVENDYAQMDYVVKNYERINNEIISGEIEIINQQFEKMGVKPEGLEIDLSIDEEGNLSPVLNSLLLDSTGKNLDLSLFQYVGGKPILKKQALAVKLFQEKLPDIINLVKISGRKDGLKAAHDKKTVITLSGASASKSEKEIVKKDYTPEEIADITDPDELARIEENFNS